jgi:hypothetical protein
MGVPVVLLRKILAGITLVLLKIKKQFSGKTEGNSLKIR